MPPAPPSDAGFTLLDTLVVVGVLALASALVFPAFRPVARTTAVESGRSALLANLRGARATAIRQDADVSVQITPVAGGYLWNGHRVALAGGAHLDASRGDLVFHPDGDASDARFAIVAGARRLGVVVDGGTGGVTAESAP